MLYPDGYLGDDALAPVAPTPGGPDARRRIVFDAGATSLMPRAVARVVTAYLTSACANPHTEAHGPQSEAAAATGRRLRDEDGL